jgi:hypothetical protein
MGIPVTPFEESIELNLTHQCDGLAIEMEQIDDSLIYHAFAGDTR